VLRLQVLLAHGGVYADMDTLFLRPPPPPLFRQACVMGRERLDTTVPQAAAGGSLCNALIMAEPNADFLRRWLERLPDAFDGSWSGHATFLPYALSRRHPELIHVEPEASFYPFDWTPDGIAALFERRAEVPEATLSLHLWAHLWWDRARRDVSRFSAERLTAGYVRHADTTYAQLARRFLPRGREQSWLRYRTELAREQARAAVAAAAVRLRRLAA